MPSPSPDAGSGKTSVRAGARGTNVAGNVASVPVMRTGVSTRTEVLEHDELTSSARDRPNPGLRMTDYVVTCVDRSSGGDAEHNHIYQAFVRPVSGGMGRLLPVKDIRREIKLGYHHFLSEDERGQRVPVKRYKCKCGF